MLLDPPAIPVSVIGAMAHDPTWRTYDTLAAASAAIAAANPTWTEGDVRATAEAMMEVDVVAARSVVLDNGDWDAGLAALADPAAAGIPVWIVRGEPASGGLTLDRAAEAYAAALRRRPRHHDPGRPAQPTAHASRGDGRGLRTSPGRRLGGPAAGPAGAADTVARRIATARR